MWEVIMQTSEPVSTMEDTEKLVKIFNSTFAKSDFEQVASNKTHMNAEEITQY